MLYFKIHFRSIFCFLSLIQYLLHQFVLRHGIIKGNCNLKIRYWFALEQVKREAMRCKLRIYRGKYRGYNALVTLCFAEVVSYRIHVDEKLAVQLFFNILRYFPQHIVQLPDGTLGGNLGVQRDHDLADAVVVHYYVVYAVYKRILHKFVPEAVYKF